MLSPSQKQCHLQLPLTSTLIWKVADWRTCGLPTPKAQVTASLSSLGVVGGASSDLSEGELERSPGLFHLQLEGVFIGVMLHDIVVHVHQDPFFTLLEDFPNLFLGNIIFVRDSVHQAFQGWSLEHQGIEDFF